VDRKFLASQYSSCYGLVVCVNLFLVIIPAVNPKFLGSQYSFCDGLPVHVYCLLVKISTLNHNSNNDPIQSNKTNDEFVPPDSWKISEWNHLYHEVVDSSYMKNQTIWGKSFLDSLKFLADCVSKVCLSSSTCMSIVFKIQDHWEVAMISRLLEITGLFCKRAL